MTDYQISGERLQLSGACQLAQLQDLWQRLQADPSLTQVTQVDCQELQAIDSSTVAFLLTLLQSLSTQVRVLNLSASLLTLIELYNLQELFAQADQGQEA